MRAQEKGERARGHERTRGWEGERAREGERVRKDERARGAREGARGQKGKRAKGGEGARGREHVRVREGERLEPIRAATKPKTPVCERPAWALWAKNGKSRDFISWLVVSRAAATLAGRARCNVGAWSDENACSECYTTFVNYRPINYTPTALGIPQEGHWIIWCPPIPQDWAPSYRFFGALQDPFLLTPSHKQRHQWSFLRDQLSENQHRFVLWHTSLIDSA